MRILTSILGFIRVNWQVILLVVVVACGYAWMRHQQGIASATIDKLNASHQLEIDVINKARIDENEKHAAQLKQLDASLEQVKDDYTRKIAAISSAQAVQQKQIVKKYDNDIVGLANALADKLGFIVVIAPMQ